MKPTFRKSMIWLHTYAGLFFAWLLFAIFLTGTLSYYNTEISHWMRAQVNTNQHVEPSANDIQRALQTLSQRAPDAVQWGIDFADDRGGPMRLRYRTEEERHSWTVVASPETGTFVETAPLETRGGNFFRTFHYTLSLRDLGGRYLTGIAAMVMLIGVFSGIYTHRRFFQDFFTLRGPDKLKYLKDLHAVFGVVTIPFCFVICFSALLIYISMYVPFSIHHYFDSYRQLDSQVSTRYSRIEPQDDSLAKPANIPNMLAQLNAQWGSGYRLDSLSIDYPHRENARYIFTRDKDKHLSNKPESIALNYAGERLELMPKERLARNIRRIFYGLHEAHFAEPVLRAVLFSLGMMSSVLIASGVSIWLNKRQGKNQAKKDKWITKLHVGVTYGLCLAVAGYLLCSRFASWQVAKGGSSAAMYTESAASMNTNAMSVMDIELSLFFGIWLASVIACIVFANHLGKRLVFLACTLAFSALFMQDLLAKQGVLLALQRGDVAYLTISFLLFLSTAYFAVRFYRLAINKTGAQENDTSRRGNKPQRKHVEDGH